MSSNNSFIIFFTYTITSIDSSANCYQNNKEKDYKKKLVKDILSKEVKEKNNNMVVNNAKIYQKMKNKKLVEYRKKHYKIKKKHLI